MYPVFTRMPGEVNVCDSGLYCLCPLPVERLLNPFVCGSLVEIISLLFHYSNFCLVNLLIFQTICSANFHK